MYFSFRKNWLTRKAWLHSGEGDEPNHVFEGRFYGLELIFGSTCTFSRGSKSAGKITGAEGRGRWRVASPMANSNNGAFCFCLFWHMNCFLLLLFLCNIFTNEAKRPSGKASTPNAYRTWVRIPGPPLSQYIFLQVITCRSRRVVYHTPSHIKVPDGPRLNLVIQE